MIPLRLFFGAVIFAMLTLSFSAPASAQGAGDVGLTVVESDMSFEDTWAAVAEALQANENISVLGQIDHEAAASVAGLDLDPNRVVFFGNPALGTPIMQASRSAALDLPQKIQVYEVDGTAYVAYNSADYLGARHAAADVETLPTIAGALANFASVAAGTDAGDAATAGSVMAGEGTETTASDNGFETTWRKLVAAIEASPAQLAFAVDHGANSNGDLRPTRLAIFGNPRIGTPMMNENPTSGIDLPLKIVVWEGVKGETNVTVTDPSYIGKRHNISSATDALAAASTAIDNFVAAATAEGSKSDDSNSGSAANSASSSNFDEDKKADLPQTGSQNAAPILIGAFLLMAGGIFLLTGDRLNLTER